MAVENVVTEPKWMVGLEWDMINLIRDMYCRLVLGQSLQMGGQGLALQQQKATDSPVRFHQAKTAERPLQGGGIAVVPLHWPRQLLSYLSGITTEMVEKLERDMTLKCGPKDQVRLY